MRRTLALLFILLGLSGSIAACGDDDLPRGCFRDDGEVECVQQQNNGGDYNYNDDGDDD